MLRIAKGNMYPWVDVLWNPITGKCPHECVYCYMNMFPQRELRLNEKFLKDNLGESKTIFVGSGTDMFADKVPREWIERVLEKCRMYAGNTYLFQTKNPAKFWYFDHLFPRTTIFGVTLETNRDITDVSLAPSPKSRASNMHEWFMKRKMISIEPILDFDLEPFVEMIKGIKPEFVSIGADSKGHNLAEPSKEKVEALIAELRFTEVKIKSNLRRLGVEVRP